LPSFEFTVDAALLKELGERLVGQPHIALAELIKNSYDADANQVVVGIDNDSITITDDGDGMSTERFRDFWMRVGSPHKQNIDRTHKNRRPTGSKGIGRLAVQFLGSEMELRTSPREATAKQLVASVNWSEATKAKDLTRARVSYTEAKRTEPYANDQPNGVEIVIRGLNQTWGEDDLKNLAQQIWQLQPPFQQGDESDFEVVLEHEDAALKNAFTVQMHRNLDIWSARLRGRLLPQVKGAGDRTRRVQLTLEFAGETPELHQYDVTDCDLHKLDFEVRIFSLYNRQRYGIGVEDAREYLRKYGGVHIYDGGFHLPYYGPETDWLRTEIDHSHRLSRSKLLPEELQIEAGLNNLPTNSRLYGVVRVDTSLEREMAAKERRLRLNEFLQIQASRDRLVDNSAYKNLRNIVRYALDFYAVRQTARMQSIPKAGRIGEAGSAKVRRVEEVLTSFERDIPPKVYRAISAEVREAVKASETDAEVAVKQLGLMGALATAGIAAIAYEHEAAKQLTQLEEIARRYRKQLGSEIGKELSDTITTWIRSARQTRALFTPLNNAENREIRTRLKAKALVEEIVSNIAPLTRSVTLDTERIDDKLRLPLGTLAEWSAVFQNVIINAANAMLDSDERTISFWSSCSYNRNRIYVEDTGCGVDLKHSETLFQPFVRKLEISADRRELGLGGMGMGLAIVRMVANNLNCRVRFAEPSEGFATCFELSWGDV
jgi:signal transduction histidine kinase